MAAKSLVLHIGDPKTGTSSIQHVLRNNLWESSTISLAYPGQLNSFPLANALSDPKQAAQREARYTKLAKWLESTDADVAVVSAEQFFRVDPQKLLDTLNEFVPDYVPTLRVVAYVRPHASRFLSAFMQRGKAGLYFGDVDTFFKKTKAEKLLRFAPRFQRWRDTFGDRFTLRPMIRSELRDGDVVSDFLDIILGGAPFKLVEAVDANPSLPLEHLVGLRELQAVLKRNQIANGVRHAVGDYVGMTLARTHPRQGTKLQINEEIYKKVKLFCQSDAETLDAVFFDGQPLMAQALKQAGADVVAEQQPMAIASHFSEQSIVALRENSRNLVSMFKKRPMAWTMDFEQKIGQRMPKPGTEPPKQLLAHVAKVDDTLTKIAHIIAEESLAKPK